MARKSQEDKLREMQELAKVRGGDCLSNEYLRNDMKLHWRCNKGHEWQAAADNVKRGGWCPACAAESVKVGIETMQQIAQSHDGVCLSLAYVNAHTKLRWQCSEGHEWDATPDKVKNRKHWCPFCSMVAPGELVQMQQIAQSQGGVCLSLAYVNAHTKLRWQCSEGHQWDASPSNVKRGTWCPICAGHQPGRTYVSPPPLIIEELQQLARERGGECLSTTYTNNRTRLRWRCAAGHEWEATAQSVKQHTHWCPVCSVEAQRLTLADMHQLAQERGGECLSTEYVNAGTNLRWRCVAGHEWGATPSNVKHQGSWCYECQKLTLAEMQELAQKRGGQCLSIEYVNSYTPMLWQCGQGHQWNARPSNVKFGTWCPICAGKQ